MRILIRHGDSLRKFLVVNSSNRDGSLNVTVRREGENTNAVTWGTRPEEKHPTKIDFETPRQKTKQLTIHQSGRVNYKENGRTIYIEPLTRTSRTAFLYQYRVPSLLQLDVLVQQPDPGDTTWDLTDLGQGAVSFSFFVGPPDLIPSSKGIKLSYDAEGYSLLLSVEDHGFAVPDGYESCFITWVPERGLFAEQQMPEDEALIAYHRSITGAPGQILYGPNSEGFIRLIFSVPMRIAPAFRIELADPKLHVTDQDIIRDKRSDKVMLTFMIRERDSGRIVRHPVEIRSIELDARL